MPESGVMLHLNLCARPCWLGITPGTTTAEEADQRIKKMYPEALSEKASRYIIWDNARQAPFSVLLSADDKHVITMTALALSMAWVNSQSVSIGPTTLTVVDLNTIWGNPRYVWFLACAGDWIVQYDIDNDIGVQPSIGYPNPNARLSLNNPVSLIRMYLRACTERDKIRIGGNT